MWLRQNNEEGNRRIPESWCKDGNMMLYQFHSLSIILPWNTSKDNQRQNKKKLTNRRANRDNEKKAETAY